MKNLNDIFFSKLVRLGVEKIEVNGDVCQFTFGEEIIIVNLWNLRLEYEKNNDEQIVTEFVKEIENIAELQVISSWDDIKEYIRWSLESSICQSTIESLLTGQITETLFKIYTYTSPDKSRLFYITRSMLERWRVGEEDVFKKAEKNMNKIISEVKLELEEVDGVKIGILSLEETFLKASIILAPVFHDLVFHLLGWPVYVVAPCRDFVYVISEKNSEFLGRFGNIVVKEFSNSGYPVTQEVLKISDLGVEAIGTFAS
jgi:hypothetical protein